MISLMIVLTRTLVGNASEPNFCHKKTQLVQSLQAIHAAQDYEHKFYKGLFMEYSAPALPHTP